MSNVAVLKEAELRELVDKAIKLDKAIKTNKKKLDGIKAALQAEGLREIENKNIKQVELFGREGSSQIGYSESLEITNLNKLCGLIGENVEDNITREESVKITPSKGFKAALIAVYKGECQQYDIEKVLENLLLDNKARKAAMKKLKGDYFKDKAVLESFGCEGDLEEELDVIRRQRNYEDAVKYIDIDSMNAESLKEFRTTMSLEEKLSVGLSYEAD